MADTRRTTYRLEQRYLDALEQIAHRLHGEDEIRRPDTTAAIRWLVERECERRKIALPLGP